jgi:glutamyl-tRNA synthetase
VNATVPLVQEKIEKFSQYPDFVRFLFEEVTPEGADARICAAAADRLETVDPWDAATLEETLRALAEELGEKPRTAFAPIRLALTGTKVSPGLFESMELLGRTTSLARLRAVSSTAAA